MSLQWTLVATFLYVEIAFIVILLLPFISPTRWQKIFRSRIVTGLSSYASIYFNVILVALVLLLLDAIREITKYKTKLNTSNDPAHGSLHYGASMELVREFRAQRNFYIAGTSLFLWFVFKRLLALITNSAQLIAENKAIKQQAESASRTASALLESSSKDSATKKAADSADKQVVGEVESLSNKLRIKDEELDNVNKSLKTARVDLEAMKKQSENLSKEYDHLLKEHAKLQAKLEAIENGGSVSGGENKKKN